MISSYPSPATTAGLLPQRKAELEANRSTVLGGGFAGIIPQGSMYGIFTYIGWVFMAMANVGKYTSPMDPMGLKVAHLGGIGNMTVLGLAKKKRLKNNDFGYTSNN